MATPLPLSQFHDDVHLYHEVDPLPFTNSGMGMARTARVSYNSVGNPYQIVPGTFKMYKLMDPDGPDVDSNRVYASGIMPWFELTAETRTYRNAGVAFLSAYVYSLSIVGGHGVWTKRTAWGGTDLVAHGFVWVDVPTGSEPGGLMTSTLSPTGARVFGWNSVSVAHPDRRFGGHWNDTGAPGDDGFIRAHGWPANEWTSTDRSRSLFWPSIDPNQAEDAVADRDLGDSIVALAWGMEVVTVGPDAAAANFVLQTGIDHQYEGMPVSGFEIGEREGTGGRARRVGTTPIWVTGNTLSDEQLALYPPPWADNVITPPGPVDPPSLVLTGGFTKADGTPLTSLDVGDRWYFDITQTGDGTATGGPPYLSGFEITTWSSRLGPSDQTEVWNGSGWDPPAPVSVGPGVVSLTSDGGGHGSPHDLTGAGRIRVSGLAAATGVAVVTLHSVAWEVTSNTISDSVVIGSEGSLDGVLDNAPAVPVPPARRMRATLWNEDYTVDLGVLHTARENHIEYAAHTLGGGSFTMWRWSPERTKLLGGRIVQTQVWNPDNETWVGAFQWRIEDTPDDTIAQTLGARVVQPSGQGLAQDFDVSHVDPYGGPGATPWGDVRSFGWDAPELDESLAPWGPPDQRAVQGARTIGPPQGRYGDPVTFPNKLALYLWGETPVAGTHDRVGFNYFRFNFTLEEDRYVTIYVVADDLFTASLNGVNIILFNNESDDAILRTSYRRLLLKAGDYLFAARVENVDRPGNTSNCGLLSVAATYDVGPIAQPTWGTTQTREFLFTTSDDGTRGPLYGVWRSLAYPATAPGLYPGGILYILFNEAQDRGELPGWHITFGPGEDTAGTPWPEVVPDFNVPVGKSFLEVLNMLVDQGFIQWSVSPVGMYLDVWVADTTVDASPAVFEEGNQIIRLTHTEKWGLERSKMLARTENGWVRRGSGARQATLSIPDMTDVGKINQYLDRQIARTSDDARTADLTFLPRTGVDTPTVGYRIFDSVTIPSPTYAPAAERVMGWTLDERPVGPPACAVQLISVVRSAEEHIIAVQDRLTPGGFNGRAASVAPATKAQPDSNTLTVVEIGQFNLPDSAENAQASAISNGLAYADSNETRPQFRVRPYTSRLTATRPQSGEGAPTGTSTVSLYCNGHRMITLSLGPGVYEVNEYASQTLGNDYPEIDPGDGLQVRLDHAGSHRGLLFTLVGSEIPG